MRRRRRSLALLGLAAGGIFAVWNLVLLAPKAAFLGGASRSVGSAQQFEIAHSHDALGYETFRPSGVYTVDGAPLTCTYGEWTRNFAWAAQRSDALRSQASRTIHHSGKFCELAAGDPGFYVGREISGFVAGLLLMLASAAVWKRSSSATNYCPSCNSTVRPKYKFCPECAASITNDHPIAV